VLGSPHRIATIRCPRSAVALLRWSCVPPPLRLIPPDTLHAAGLCAAFPGGRCCDGSIGSSYGHVALLGLGASHSRRPAFLGGAGGRRVLPAAPGSSFFQRFTPSSVSQRRVGAGAHGVAGITTVIESALWSPEPLTPIAHARERHRPSMFRPRFCVQLSSLCGA